MNARNILKRYKTWKRNLASKSKLREVGGSIALQLPKLAALVNLITICISTNEK